MREQSVVSFVDRSVKSPFTVHAIDFLARDVDRSFAISKPVIPVGYLLEEPSGNSIAILLSSVRFKLSLGFFNLLF